jgi:site-specific recombinase XerD
LRHTFATHLWESGIDAFILRDLLGHRYLGTTRRYVAIGLGRVAADYNAHHPLCQRDFWDEDDN